MLLPSRIEGKGRNTPLGIQQQAEEVSFRVSACETADCASRTGGAESLTPLAEKTVMRKRAKRTSTQRSLGALSRLEICSRAHDVRSSDSCHNTRVRDSVSKDGQYCTERVWME
jgi:hypothetical protein